MGKNKSSKSSAVVAGVEPAVVVEETSSAPVVPTASVSLPARPIRTVATTSAASSTFHGIGTMMAQGIPAGLRRNAFQDALLERNEAPDMHLSDDELARIMDAEHPFGGVRIADRPELVATIRKFYNAGKHGKQQQTVPAVQSLQYAKPLNKTGHGRPITDGADVEASTAEVETTDDVAVNE